MTCLQQTVIYCRSPFTALSCPKPCFLIRYPNSTAMDMINHGLPEQSLIDWCRQFCNGSSHFIDIGAHCGMYALSLAPYSSKVFAFECQRETFYQLCGGVALNAAWNVYPEHVALGNAFKEKIPLFIQSLDGGGTSTKQKSETTIQEIQEVEMRTLDSYHLDNISFLKLDVEGAEEDVLRGGYETLKRSHFPPFVFESWTDDKYSNERNSLNKYITSLGYEIIPINSYPHMMFASHPDYKTFFN